MKQIREFYSSYIGLKRTKGSGLLAKTDTINTMSYKHNVRPFGITAIIILREEAIKNASSTKGTKCRVYRKAPEKHESPR